MHITKEQKAFDEEVKKCREALDNLKESTEIADKHKVAFVKALNDTIKDAINYVTQSE
jgi:hypothetical protein